MQVIINNILTNYEKQGRGPVVLFMHGWGDDFRTFKPLLPELSKNYTCVLLDLPGAGGSNAPEEAWSVKDFAEFVAAFVKKIKAEPSFVIGHSNGGTITMYCAAHNLLSPEKIILLASAGIRSEDSLKKNLYKLTAKTGKQITRFLPKNVQNKLRRKLYTAAGSDILVAPHLEETFKKVVSYDIAGDAQTIATPTLLIYAEDDTATPVRYGEKLKAAIKQSELKILQSGGHFVHQTQATEVSRLIKDFLNE